MNKARKNPQTFRTWLKQYQNDRSIIGDLAGDAFADEDWKGNTIASLKKVMINANACDGAFDALTEATQRYRSYVKAFKAAKEQ